MTNKLMFACRTCQFSEEAVSSCVFRNNLYNTVGETAGVTQDVGSDPTVSGVDSDVFCVCCVLCGMELGGEEEEEEEEEKEESGSLGVEEREKGMNVTVFDLCEMSRMEEDEDEEMGGEPDTTRDDNREITSHHHAAEKRECARGERITHPQKQTQSSSPPS